MFKPIPRVSLQYGGLCAKRLAPSSAFSSAIVDLQPAVVTDSDRAVPNAAGRNGWQRRGLIDRGPASASY